MVGLICRFGIRTRGLADCGRAVAGQERMASCMFSWCRDSSRLHSRSAFRRSCSAAERSRMIRALSRLTRHARWRLSQPLMRAVARSAELSISVRAAWLEARLSLSTRRDCMRCLSARASASAMRKVAAGGQQSMIGTGIYIDKNKSVKPAIYMFRVAAGRSLAPSFAAGNFKTRVVRQTLCRSQDRYTYRLVQ